MPSTSNTNNYKPFNMQLTEEEINRIIHLLKGIAQWPGNLSDKVLQSKTGPNDAALRGGMVCDMRDIAIEAIRIVEPDYTPFK